MLSEMVYFGKKTSKITLKDFAITHNIQAGLQDMNISYYSFGVYL